MLQESRNASIAHAHMRIGFGLAELMKAISRRVALNALSADKNNWLKNYYRISNGRGASLCPSRQ
jgi:hypothetical protein